MAVQRRPGCTRGDGTDGQRGRAVLRQSGVRRHAATSIASTRSRCASSPATPTTDVAPGNGTIAARFARAAELRWLLFGASPPQAMRLFSGESEGLPGVTVDRYGDFVVVQWLSGGRAALAGRAVRRDREPPGARAASTSSGGCARSAGGGPPEPAVRARGDEAPLELVVEDGGCRFGVDVTAPLGVGLFPDMRLGWAAVAARAAGRARAEPVLVHRRVLRARRQGRRRRGGRRRHRGQGARARAPQLRAVGPGPGASCEAMTADAVKTLERFASRGPLVRHRGLRSADVLARARRGSSRSPATWRSWRRACVAVLAPGGLLVFATQLDQAVVRRAGSRAGGGRGAARAELRIIERVGLPPDYPGRARLPRGQLPQVRDRDPRAVAGRRCGR